MFEFRPPTADGIGEIDPGSTRSRFRTEDTWLVSIDVFLARTSFSVMEYEYKE